MSRTFLVEVDGAGQSSRSIQAAIDEASNGDIIVVGPGTYRENVDFKGKQITLKSLSGPDQTIIDGSGNRAPVVMFANGEGPGAVLDGFTVTGGTGFLFQQATHWGGGIYCPGAGPVIRRNVIKKNSVEAPGDGGGMVAWGPALIENNVFDSNHAAFNGGALTVGGPGTVVRNNLFVNNTTGRGDGGAIWAVVGEGDVAILGNRFIDNDANDHGGAIEASCFVGCRMFVEGNIFVGNTARGKDGTFENGAGGAISARRMVGEIVRNTIYGNTGVGYTECSGGGIFIDFPSSDALVVESNIVAANTGGGIVCYRTNPSVRILGNLLWENTPADFRQGDRDSPPELMNTNMFADPMFCSLSSGDYTVSRNSPALEGGKIIGALSEPGCSLVPVISTTWGGLKALYRK